MIGPTPLLDFFKRGEVSRDVRISAARGELAPRAYDQLAILMILVDDAEPEIRETAEATLGKIVPDALKRFLGRSDTPAAMLDFFARRGIKPDAVVQATDQDDDTPLVKSAHAPGLDDSTLKPSWPKREEAAAAAAGAAIAEMAATARQPAEMASGRPEADNPSAESDEEEVDPELGESRDADGKRLSASQMIGKMTMLGRLKAAVKGTREMRALLIRDPNKMISAAVLSSPKLNDAEIASFAKMQNVSEDVLRIIANNRAWTKSYTVIWALVKNPKTPVAQSMGFLARLSAKDISMLAVDRNVPDPIRVAAKKRAAAIRLG